VSSTTEESEFDSLFECLQIDSEAKAAFSPLRTRALSPVTELQGRKAYYSVATSAESESAWD
jgi:hypothetical protein